MTQRDGSAQPDRPCLRAKGLCPARAGSASPVAADHELVVTHGNGPQVGVLALQSAADPRLTTPYPFGVLGMLADDVCRLARISLQVIQLFVTDQSESRILDGRFRVL